MSIPSIAKIENQRKIAILDTSFWRIVTEGDHTENDKVDINRLEKLPWINPIIDGQPDSDWWLWETKKKKKMIGF